MGGGAAGGTTRGRLFFVASARPLTRGCRECFHLEVADTETGDVELEVAVLKGGLLDILVEVADPNGNKLLSRMYFEGKGDSKIPLVAEKPGDYELCFNNEMARWTSKTVSMVRQGGEGWWRGEGPPDAAQRATIKTKAVNSDAVKPEDLTTLDKKLLDLEGARVVLVDAGWEGLTGSHRHAVGGDGGAAALQGPRGGALVHAAVDAQPHLVL